MRKLAIVGLTLVAGSGCYTGLDHGSPGNLDTNGATSGAGDETGGTGEPVEDPDQVAPTGLRRLTSNEYDNTLADLLLDETRASNLLLPEDLRTPFDNDYTLQDPSLALIEAADLLAADAAARLLADPAKRDHVVGCTPQGPGDEACFRAFVTQFGRRAFRRPLTQTEVSGFMTMLDHAIEADDFYVGVDSVVRSALQSPSFLYRVEVGQPVPDQPELFRLNGFEVATRLSYLVWGSMPSDDLLETAEAGGLEDAESIRAVAEQMLEDPRALDRVARFHALWMGYESLPVDYELAVAMEAETRALMQRVIFEERRPWQDLLRLGETWVDGTLAAHYGLAPPADGQGWVSYGDSGRKGLLSHGSFLSLGAKFGDTSPTQRGLLIRTRLFCQEIAPPPPDADVNVDQPPGDPETQCKAERYAAHQVAGTSCKGCHELIDPIGFGLEQYDQQGRFRTHDNGKPDCEIEGVGELVGVGEFSGPAELADLMIESGLLNRCVTTHLYRYAIGRYALGELDHNYIDEVVQRMGVADFRFDELVLELVSSEMFRYRWQEEV